MKHIRQFESFSRRKKLLEVIKESVMIVDDVYKVNVTAEIPQSLLNSYIKKVKDGLDKNVRQFYSDVQLAEEITKHVLQKGLNIDSLQPSDLFGGAPQAQPQSGQAQVQVQSQPQAQVQPQVQAQPQDQLQAQPQMQAQPQVQAQPQGQVQDELQFEEPAQGQVQAQFQPQGQSQGEVQTQGQGQAQGQGEEDEEDNEELPL